MSSAAAAPKPDAVPSAAGDGAAPAVAHSNYVPQKMERNFTSLHFSRSGALLLGCTSMTAEFWTGSVWYFKDPAAAPSVKGCLTGLDMDAGLSDAAFLDDQGKRVKF